MRPDDDDLIENIAAAKDLGLIGYQFHSAMQLAAELEKDGILAPLELP